MKRRDQWISSLQSIKPLIEYGLTCRCPDILGIEVAELKPQDLDVLAKKTKLLITVVGPYALYGMPVVEACARNGTHYLDVYVSPPTTINPSLMSTALAKLLG